MGMRFRKSIKFGKHFSVNLSPKGVGYSYGVKGARHSVSADGKHRTSYSVPGTGLTYTTSSGRSSGSTRTPSPNRSAPKNTRNSPGCLILSLLFLAVCAIAFGCSDADTEITEQPSLPSAEVSDRAILPTDEEKSTEPSETEPAVQLPVIAPEETVPEETPAPETAPPETVPTKTVPTETLPPETEASKPAETQPPVVITYILNTSSQKIHYASCSAVDKIKDSNKSTTTDPDAKLAEGYTWCGICH